MAKSEDKKKKNEVEKLVNKVLKNLGISKKNKVVTDANGTEIDFYELEDGATPAVGDKAKIDGKEASGDVVMPSGETYVFAEGALSEIKEESEEEESEEVEDLKEDLAAANKKYKALKKAHNALKAENEEKTNKLKGIKKDMKKLKKNLSGSNFQYKPNKKNFSRKETGTRSVFKPVEE